MDAYVPGSSTPGGTWLPRIERTTMKPYEHIKLDPCPDIADGKLEGRKASAVNLPGKGGKIRTNQIPRHKAESRRYLKHVDKARVNRQIKKDAE